MRKRLERLALLTKIFKYGYIRFRIWHTVKHYCYDLCSKVLWLYYFTKVSINSAIFLPLFQYKPHLIHLFFTVFYS